MKLCLLVIAQLLLAGCMTSYPNEGIFSAIDSRQSSTFDKLYGGETYYRFNSHRQYLQKVDKEYKILVVALISRLMKDKQICQGEYFVPEQEIGGAEGGHIEALVVCKKSSSD